MTEPRKHDLPDGLVDVPRCLAEAAEVRRKSWDDPALRRFGLQVLAAQVAIVGLAVLATVVVTQGPSPGGIEVAKTWAPDVQRQNRSGTH